MGKLLKESQNEIFGEKEINKVIFKLSAFEAFELLHELEHSLSIKNRDSSAAKRLFEKISTQLHGAVVKFNNWI